MDPHHPDAHGGYDMNDALLALLALNYAAMFVLPRVFFRRDGRFNLRWWLTSAPFGGGAWAILLCRLGVLTPLVSPRSPAGAWLALIAVPLALASVALMAATVATHKVPLALWHQTNDRPHSIVTHGPYRLVRHPFYSSFLLLLLASIALAPHALSVGSLAVAVVVLSLTARREERNLLSSAYGTDYAAYLGRTGRFVPRWQVAAR
jgi:protein-S-isoprenylcysteine O-methyltransferase Ste14